MLYEISKVFFMFFSYSLFGWLVECIDCTIEGKKITFDRGFLIGPYCPIYGWGALYMYFFLSEYSSDPITLFIMAVVGTSIIEFITSYLMEKIFKARWWDYSNNKFNFEGRICLKNSLLFGLLGIVFVYFINPFYLGFIDSIGKNLLIIISTIAFIVYLTDTVVSFFIMTKLKNHLSGERKDSTTDIKKFIFSHNYIIKRLFKAFPKINIPSGEKMIEGIEDVLSNFDISKARRKEKIKTLKEQIKKEEEIEIKKELKNKLKTYKKKDKEEITNVK